MAATPDTPAPAPADPPRRARIVLAEVGRRSTPRAPIRTELAQGTQIGDALVRGLVRAQLALAVRLSLVVVIGLGGLPLLFAIAPTVGRVTLFGVKLPWLLLGVAAYPFLLGVGWLHVHWAERNEQDFTDLVQRPER
ncbi:hypothetical protein ACFFWC_03185 [Plantactinospora siamensis]|uniref:DUF485 domain-containing protein n=1 Tax=Plantactinospora siamensis TaxID=555372 RepID=A0ABV6NQG9_9ACTN